MGLALPCIVRLGRGAPACAPKRWWADTWVWPYHASFALVGAHPCVRPRRRGSTLFGVQPLGCSQTRQSVDSELGNAATVGYKPAIHGSALSGRYSAQAIFSWGSKPQALPHRCLAAAQTRRMRRAHHPPEHNGPCPWDGLSRARLVTAQVTNKVALLRARHAPGLWGRYMGLALPCIVRLGRGAPACAPKRWWADTWVCPYRASFALVGAHPCVRPRRRGSTLFGVQPLGCSQTR